MIQRAAPLLPPDEGMTEPKLTKDQLEELLMAIVIRLAVRYSDGWDVIFDALECVAGALGEEIKPELRVIKGGKKNHEEKK